MISLKFLYVLFYFYRFFPLQFELPKDVVDDNAAATETLNRVEENGTPEYQDEDGSTIHEVENDDDDEDKKALLQKAHSAIILSLGDKVLRQVSKEKTAVGFW